MMSDQATIFQDWRTNRGELRIQIALLLFRSAQMARSSSQLTLRLLRIPLAALYRGYALSVVGLDMPVSTKIGPGLTIYHGIGLVVHNETVIEEGVILRQCSTIGEQRSGGGAPVLRRGVEVGSNALILGSIEIGSHAKVGAGAVVTKSVPSGGVVVGNPAREVSVTPLATQQKDLP